MLRSNSLIAGLLSVVLGPALGACASDGTDTATKPAMPEKQGVEQQAELKAGVNSRADSLLFRTEDVTVEAGKEKFLCYTTILDEDAVISGYSHEAQSFVHHVVFVRTTVPEPDGISECNVLFRPTWDPLFITGAGRSELDFPNGAGHQLTKGTQLLVQLHLLNTASHDVHGPVDIVMQRSTAEDPEPVGTYVFGTTDLHLAPGQRTQVQGTCHLPDDLKLIAAFPHMHLLGRRMRFEVGETPDTMHEAFIRDPYDFDDQRAEAIDLEIAKGSYTRVTCDYDNDSAQEVTFGESTHNEMCFFVGFALGRQRITSCLQRSAADQPMAGMVPVDAAAGKCGEQPPNDKGVGKVCHPGANECDTGLNCSSDLRMSTEAGICMSLGCNSASDCGGGSASCCALPQGINVCIPEACRMPTCIPVK